MLLVACDHAERQQPVFSAYMLAQHTTLHIDKVGDAKYGRWIEEQFGIDDDGLEAIAKLFRAVRTRPALEDSVQAELALQVQALDSHPSDDNVQRLVADVLQPYLWLKRNGVPVHPSLEEALGAKAMAVLNPGDGHDGLRALTDSYYNYKHGGVFSNDSLGAFNALLKPLGYYARFSLDEPDVCIYQIDKILFDATTAQSIGLDAYVLKRTIPCAMPSMAGYSTIGAPDVVIFSDVADASARDLLTRAADSSHLYYSSPMVQSIWMSAGLQLDLTAANGWMARVDAHEITGHGEAALARDLAYEVALHEAKHKYDEARLPRRIDWDSEVSAHLTQAYYSPRPLFALTAAIRRVEGFTFAESDAKMLSLLRTLWTTLIVEGGDNYDAYHLRQSIRTIYANYRTYYGMPLPPLDDFGKTVVPALRRGFDLGGLTEAP